MVKIKSRENKEQEERIKNMEKKERINNTKKELYKKHVDHPALD